MKQKEIVDVAVCIIRRGRHFLISRRSDDDSFGGYWEFPGGKRREGEDLETCARREAVEEVGLELEIERLLETVRNPYPDHPVHLHFFMCQAKRESAGHGSSQDRRWVGAHELKSYTFPPANEKIISYLVHHFAKADD